MGWAGDTGCTPRPPIRPRPVSERRVVTVIFLGLLLDLLAFTLLLPLLPGLLENHGREQVSPSPKAGALPLLSVPDSPSWSCFPYPGPPLWLLAARGRLVCHSHRDASREKVQQCPVWRYVPACQTGAHNPFSES